MDKETQFINWVYLAADITRDFILIHPYRDGNGHLSRFIISAFLIPLGRFPHQWTIHPRPQSEYTSAMVEAGDGNINRLAMMIINDFKK
ncbi:MAG: Fic family protein [Sphaerochaetaceae bacterium]|jgi:Fic family protein|nr:Fic family protein [Sphaerochaetaceae bacterium]